MKGRRALLAVALLTFVGIVGMLLTQGAWNLAFFALAASPLAIGVRWRIAAHAAQATSARR